MKHKSNAQSGFSLIQLSIVIVIASIGLAAAAKLATVQFQQDREERLNESFEDINDLLLAYYTGVDENGDRNERLPCPARRDLAIDHPAFGREDCGAFTPTESDIDHPDDPGRKLRVMIGALPVKELSISTENAFDVFGGQLLYAVSEEMTSPTNFGRNDVAAIKREDSDGVTLGQPLPFLVVSAGDTGIGTYNKGGTLIATCPATGSERENCDGDFTFLDADISESEDTNTFFDDRIGFDGTFLADIARFQVPDFTCPDGEFVRGFLDGSPICNEDIQGNGSQEGALCLNGISGNGDQCFGTIRNGKCRGSCSGAGASR